MEAVVLHGVRFLEYFCIKQGQDFKPLAAPVNPNMGQVHPPPPGKNGINNVLYVFPFNMYAEYLKW